MVFEIWSSNIRFLVLRKMSLINVFKGSRIIFLVLYIDDIQLASNDIDFLLKIKSFLSKNFEMNLETLLLW